MSAFVPVSERYAVVVAELDAVEDYRLRLLGQADLLKALIDAGQGHMRVPAVGYNSPLPESARDGDAQSNDASGE